MKTAVKYEPNTEDISIKLVFYEGKVDIIKTEWNEVEIINMRAD